MAKDTLAEGANNVRQKTNNIDEVDGVNTYVFCFIPIFPCYSPHFHVPSYCFRIVFLDFCWGRTNIISSVIIKKLFFKNERQSSSSYKNLSKVESSSFI